MGRRAVAVLCSMGLLMAVLSSSPAAARSEVNASVEEITTIGDNIYGNVAFSLDLSTAAYFPFDGNGNSAELTIIDIAADTKRIVSTPRPFTDLVFVNGIDADGSTVLIGADWEGLEAGDGDGGLLDVFLLETSSGDVEPLTASLSDVSAWPISIDDDGDTALMAVYTSEQEGALYLWDDGALTELSLPGDAFAGLNSGGQTVLSPDGTSLLYSTRLGFQTRWHLHRLADGTESVIAAPSGLPPVLSADGSVVVSGAYTSDPESSIFVWDTSGTQLRRLPSVSVPQRLLIDRSGTTAVTTAYAIRDVNGFEQYVNELVRVDLTTGERSVIASLDEGSDMQLFAADVDLDRVVVRSSTSFGQSFPVSGNVAYGGSDYSPGVYLLDTTGSTATPPLPAYSGTLDDQMARLYEAYFDRAPDAGGLEFWRNQRSGGRSLDSVSDEFARSPEFVETYGALADEAFVDLVYSNVLDRAPDAGGRAFWLDQLSNGRTRGSLMTLFSESPEFIDTTGTQAAEFPNAAAVRRLYGALLGRAADPAGLASWTAEADRGMPLDDIAWYIMQTEEFQELYGGFEFDPFAMVTIALANGVAGDPVEADWVLADSYYTEGRPIEEIIVDVTNSARFVAATSSTPISG